MFPKEVETLSDPISLSKHSMLDGEVERFTRERSHSFQNMMKNNMPNIAKIPSPKPRRKHHHHHRRSPVMPRREAGDRVVLHESRSLLTVSGHHDAYRQRSFSDTQLAALESPDSSPLLLRKAIYTRQKSTIDTVDGGDSDSGISIIIKEHDSVDDHTISRESMVENGKEGTTITRRREEVLSEVKNKEHNRKKRMLDMIDELLEQCNENYCNLENDIDSLFSRLHMALDNRKVELLEEAATLRNSKIEKLKESREKCLISKRVGLSTHNSLSSDESPLSTGSNSRRGSEDQENCLQSNGIYEPWKSSPNEGSDQVTSDLGIVVDKLNDGESIFSEILEEGNMTVLFDDESMEIFNSIGKIDCIRSSPQLSFIKGLNGGFALLGESIHFEVYPRNVANQNSFNSKDDIKCEVHNVRGEKIKSNNAVSLQRCLSNGRVVSDISPNTSLHKFYSYVLTPRVEGKYEVRISINGVEINTSPFLLSVFPRVDLTFDLNSPGERNEMTLVNNSEGLTLQQRRQALSRRQSSEDIDWADNNWIVQKGDKSSLLRSATEAPSYIYASPAVKGLCAWKIRMTSACESITLSVGVGTRSGIPDIDEHFSCNFSIKAASEKAKVSSKGTRMQVRRTSSFTRISFTYDVLLSTEEGIVRIICEQNEESKTVRINPKTMEKFELYPFISMIHRRYECARQVCPRPQITLL